MSALFRVVPFRTAKAWELRLVCALASAVCSRRYTFSFFESCANENQREGEPVQVAAAADRGEASGSAREEGRNGQALPVPERLQAIDLHTCPANIVELDGILISEVDIVYLDTGHVVGRTSIRPCDGRMPKNSCIMLELWDELAEIAAAHLKKGDCLHVSGLLHICGTHKDRPLSRWSIRVSELNCVR